MKPAIRRLQGLGLLVLAIGIAFIVLSRNDKKSDSPQTRKIKRQERSVLLITIDTTRADRLGPYGATDVETPTLDRLARQGVLFDRAYSVAPITLVAHTSILTGLNPPEHGVRNNGTHHVDSEIRTLAEILSEEGFRTGAFVSAAVLEKRYGLDQGFEIYDDDLSTGRERNRRMVADRPAEAVVDSVRSWLDTLEDEEPFFAWAHFYDPHASYSPPAPFRDRYRERLYDGEIAYMDSEIGRLLQHPRLVSDKDLVVMVIGDHGESLGEHGEQTHAILAYDSTLRVPWIMWTPGTARGVVFPLPVGQVDLMPTVLDLLAKDVPDGLAGQSLLPWLEGSVSPEARALYSETYLPYYTYGWSKLRVLRRGSWKYVEAPTPELFDLSRDPFELSNLHLQRPGLAHDLGRDLREMLEKSDDREAALELNSEAAEKLRSLGYLGVGSSPAPTEGESRPDPKEMVDLHVGLEHSRRLMLDRLFPQAIQQLRAVLSRDSNNLAALIDLASALESLGELEEAVKSIERALALDPDYPRLHLLMAGLEMRQGRPDQALELCETALGLDPRSLDAMIQKSVYLNRLGRNEEARQTLEAALLLYPEHPRLETFYARWVDLPQKRFVAAEERLRRALDRDPFLVLAWRVLGQVCELTQRSEEAAEAYRMGLQRQPDDAELHSRLGILLARQSAGAETERHLQEAIRLSPQPRPALRVSLGGWLAEQGRLREAEEQYEIVLAADPSNAAARNNRAIAFYRTGRVEGAVEDLRQIIDDHPRYADAYNNLASIEIDRSAWESAEAYARRCVEIDDTLPEGWNNLGVALDEQGHQAEAENAFRRSLSLAPDYWQAAFNLGVLYRKAGRYQKAHDAFKKVVAQTSAYPESHLELGRLYAGPLGDAKLARTHYNAFLRVAPQHPEAAAVRQELPRIAP